MRRKRIISLVLSACLIVGSAVQGGAATTQEKISDAKAQQQANQSSLQQTQEKIQELESKKGESETYLADLNEQAQNRLHCIIAQIKETEEITEELKAQDQMAWVRAMNSIRNRAEEIVRHELIYDAKEVL